MDLRLSSCSKLLVEAPPPFEMRGSPSCKCKYLPPTRIKGDFISTVIGGLNDLVCTSDMGGIYCDNSCFLHSLYAIPPEDQEEYGIQHLQGLFEGLSHCTQAGSIGTMEKEYGDVGSSGLKFGLEDIKLHLHRVFEVVGAGVKDNREVESDIQYITNQIGCHDSRIDDHGRDLKELMGTM